MIAEYLTAGQQSQQKIATGSSLDCARSLRGMHRPTVCCWEGVPRTEACTGQLFVAGRVYNAIWYIIVLILFCLLSCLVLQLGPLRAVEGVAEIAGCLSAAGLVLILAVALSIYGSASFQQSTDNKLGVKTLSGRSVQRDPLQSADG